VKIKLDENLSREHRELLSKYGHDAATVHDEKLQGSSDNNLWREVCKEGRFLLTLDVGFADARRIAAKSHPGILLIRTSRKGSKNIAGIIRRVFEEISPEEMQGCIVVADDSKTRIRRAK